MRLLGLDLETTGLDLKKDRIIKLGAILMDSDSPVPLYEKEWTLWHDTYPQISEEAKAVHQIEEEYCLEFGEDPIGFYSRLGGIFDGSRVDYLIAHNGSYFDFPILEANIDAFDDGACLSQFKKYKKIDTACDIPYGANIQSRKLIHLASEHGFLNPFPHSALSDIRTMFKILSNYSLEEVITRSRSPNVTIQALVGYEDRDLAKAKRFFWDTNTKRWLKKIKQCDLENELAGAGFPIKQPEE